MFHDTHEFIDECVTLVRARLEPPPMTKLEEETINQALAITSDERLLEYLRTQRLSDGRRVHSECLALVYAHIETRMQGVGRAIALLFVVSLFAACARSEDPAEPVPCVTMRERCYVTCPDDPSQNPDDCNEVCAHVPDDCEPPPK